MEPLVQPTPHNLSCQANADQPSCADESSREKVGRSGSAASSVERQGEPAVSQTSDAVASSKSPSWHWGLLGLVCFCLFFYQLGSYWLFDVDEPRYAEAAREMIERQSWITPYFNYALRLEKPILFYWLEIVSYKIFGVSEFSARLVSAIAATSMVGMTYWIGRRWVSARYALFSALILATAVEVVALSRMSITDMTLSALMCATTLCLFQVVQAGPRWWVAAGLFSGLAILTKGPVGLVLPGAVLVLFSLLTCRAKAAFLTPWFAVGLLTAVAVAFPWYYLAWQENGQVFLDSLYSNNINRYNGKVDYHSEPVYFYVIVLAAGFLPWTPFLPAAVRQGWGELMQSRPWRNPLSARQSLQLYAMVWAVTVFVFFSIADTKLLTYILPMFPALGLWLGSLFDRAGRMVPESVPAAAKASPPAVQTDRWLSGTAWVLLGVITLVSLVFAVRMPALLPKEASHISDNPANWLALAVLMVGALGFTLRIQQQRIQTALITMGVTMCILAIVAVESIVPHINQATQGAMMRYLSMVGDEPLATYEIIRPSLTYYGRRKILHIGRNDRAKLEAFLKDACSTQALDQSSMNQSQDCGPVYLITKNRFLERFKAIQPAGSVMTLVDQGPVYNLIRLQVSRMPITPS